jgi:hypothetical protein
MVSQQQYYTQAPFYHQTPQQQHGAGDNTILHLTGGLETLQRALQYNTTSHTNNGNFGGVLVGKHRVIIPSLKLWSVKLAGVAFENSRSTMCFHEQNFAVFTRSII